MRLLSFLRPSDHLETWGIAVDGGVIDVGNGTSTLRQALADPAAIRDAAARKPDFQLADITYLPTITDPQKIICIGVNYKTHLAETGREQPKFPMIFARWPDAQVGHQVPMIRPNVSDTFDYEGELAVIIGKHCRHVKAADWESVVAGYACFNDGTIREWQRHTIQFHPGKNFYKSGSFGPWMVTPDEMGDPRTKTLRTRLNGEVLQDCVVDDLVFDIPSLIEYCSAFTPLNPGDVIATGTTGGVGAFHKPPKWMKPGDTIEIDIAGIGILSNPIAQEE
jgi:2-keto-4-pentenoate hydratase/2-oxohepta-3-ene-1,7-dioic acid hydratase in catechol pathway